MRKRSKLLTVIIAAVTACSVFLTACGEEPLNSAANEYPTNGVTAIAPENNEQTSGGMTVDVADKQENGHSDDICGTVVKPNAPQAGLPIKIENDPNEQMPVEQPIVKNETPDRTSTAEHTDPVVSTAKEKPSEPNEEQIFTINYLASEGGRIEGKSVQSVKCGESASPVRAVANDGFGFVGWSDGAATELRCDNVYAPFTVTAVFARKTVVSEGLLFTLLEDGTGYDVAAYNKELTVATVPAVFNGIPVKEIASSGFENCKKLTSVYLPDTVDLICAYAFKGCHYLTKITGMSGVEEICTGAFMNCTRLERVIGICNVKKIREDAFHACVSLENLILPETVEYLESAREAWNGIRYPVFLRKTKEDFESLYVDKDKGYVYRPKAIYIGTQGKPSDEYMLKEDDELFDFTPTSDGLGYAISAKDTNITEALIPSHHNGLPVTEIAERGFVDCNVVTTFIPDTVKKIGNRAFAECRKLIRVLGLNGITDIGNEAFAECSKLSGIVLPNTLENAGSYIFKNNCQTIYIRKTQSDANKLNSDWNRGRPDSAKTVCVGETGMPEDIGYGMCFIKCEPNKDLFPDVEEFMLLVLADPDLTEAIIPSYINELPVTCIWAFESCENLRWVFMPDTVRVIFRDSFLDCPKLERIYGAKNVRVIEKGNFNFEDCVNLQRFILSDKVEFGKEYTNTL